MKSNSQEKRMKSVENLKQPTSEQQSYLSIDGEEWRNVPGFPSLQASNLGRIRLSGTGQILAIVSGETYEYPRCSFTHRGKTTTKEVHRLVGLAFFGPLAPGMEVHHKNHRKADCRLDNLAVTTHQVNVDEAIKAGRCNSKLAPENINPVRKLLAAEVPVEVVAAAFDVKPNCIRDIGKRRSWRAIPEQETTDDKREQPSSLAA